MTDSLEAPALVRRGGSLRHACRHGSAAGAGRPGRRAGAGRLLALLDDLAVPAGRGRATGRRRKSTLAAGLVRTAPDRRPGSASATPTGTPVQLGARCWRRSTGRPGVGDRAARLVTDPPDRRRRSGALADDLDLAEPSGVPGSTTSTASTTAPGRSRRSSAPGALACLLLLGCRRPLLAVDRQRRGSLADLSFDALRLRRRGGRDVAAACCARGRRPSAIATWSGGWAAALSSRRCPSAGPRQPARPGPARRQLCVARGAAHRERPELVGLLMSTAVVDRMASVWRGADRSADAGATCSSRPPSEQGLFVTSLDAGGWSEVHGLVRDALLAEFAGAGRRRICASSTARQPAGTRTPGTVSPPSSTGWRRNGRRGVAAAGRARGAARRRRSRHRGRPRSSPAILRVAVADPSCWRGAGCRSTARVLRCPARWATSATAVRDPAQGGAADAAAGRPPGGTGRECLRSHPRSPSVAAPPDRPTP